MVYMISLHRMHGLSGAGCGGLGGALGFFRNIPLGALSWTTSSLPGHTGLESCKGQCGNRCNTPHPEYCKQSMGGILLS